MTSTTAWARTAVLTFTVWLASIAAATSSRLLDAPRQRRDRGALTLEQAIITAVVSAAAIALGAVIVNAISSHTPNIR